ncbi:hypothetical protein C0991_009146 [Blastosporella zonata]|nr:hypothetical protein C0991_009146 [Blastosporella zonata]
MTDDTPYTTPEEDPFNVQPILLQPRRRRSSLLDKWIQEQQKPPDEEPPPSAHRNAYLPCPETSLQNPSKEDLVTLDNYDFVDDQDIPATEVPATPTTARSKRTSKLLHTPTSFRTFKPFPLHAPRDSLFFLAIPDTAPMQPLGVGPTDVRKFDGVKKWCETFGEVSQIVRMPNGDLHIHFRLAEVADTVCRLRARVYIAGVGSVQLSWLTGDKR